MIILAVFLIIGLFVLVLVSYVLNRKTPLPEGCEEIKISTQKCAACKNEACEMKQRIKGDDDL